MIQCKLYNGACKMLPNFYGNPSAALALSNMARRRRVPQTLLLAGVEGVGKATLARRFAALLLGSANKIENDDLSLPHNLEIVEDREKWPSEKRNDDPLLFSTHPDFVTFPPDGPLRQISIQQMRLLKERAQFKPHDGEHRVFLIDHIDRANEQAANSLLKTLEEPPEHLILMLTAENAYDLLPTIRSRAVMLNLTPVNEDDMRAFVESRKLTDAARRTLLAAGSPGAAVSMDLTVYDQRRTAMLKLLEVAAGAAPFSEWTKYSETIASKKTDKLEFYLLVLYSLLEDLLLMSTAQLSPRNADIRGQLERLAPRLTLDWLRKAVQRVDELVELLRRNIQKAIALDAFAVSLAAAQPLWFNDR